MLRHILLATAVVLANPAYAQWIYQEQGGAFDDTPLRIALTGSQFYGLALRCRNTYDLELLFITPEQAEANTIGTFNEMRPLILLRIDDAEPREFPAIADLSDGNLGLIAETDADLATALIDAKRRVAVAVRVMGQLFHEEEFSVQGSTRSVCQLFDGCQLG